MLSLERALIRKITEHALRELPNEACGILSGVAGKVYKVYEMANIKKSPQDFFMDAGEQLKVMKAIRRDAREMIGIYHSHVASPAYPSSHDVELAFYPEASYVIISVKDRENPSIRSFRIVDAKISEEELRTE